MHISRITKSWFNLLLAQYYVKYTGTLMARIRQGNTMRSMQWMPEHTLQYQDIGEKILRGETHDRVPCCPRIARARSPTEFCSTVIRSDLTTPVLIKKFHGRFTPRSGRNHQYSKFFFFPTSTTQMINRSCIIRNVTRYSPILMRYRGLWGGHPRTFLTS